jgi:WD40 repeat protein
MPVASRTFRVFVSSTFEDLKEERDALQREVFPKLRTLCEQHGARFQAIDLRWGVRDEAALDQQTIEICLREIRRCQATGVRPNFIVLLGDRYGWQPLPARIPAAEFDALRPRLPELAAQLYRLDENAVPPEYCLQPRKGEFVDPATWSRIEQTLREVLTKAARAVGLPEKEMIKYEASATHQEILAGLGFTAGDREHVFAFVRPSNANTDPRVQELKSHLRVHDFDPAAVYGQLKQVIEAEIQRFEDRPAMDLEVEAHDRFAEERCRIFTGRHEVLDTIADYLGGPERRPLVLHGESGSGKSAVMAKASQQYQGPGRVIRRFIGASPESASGHALLTSLCRQMAPGETPVDYAQLENAFRERLKGELLLFIDAVDQLSANDPARRMNWLPQELLPGVKVIVSSTDEATGLVVPLEKMTPPEGGQALDEMLREADCTLRPWQRDKVLEHFARCGLPLYLKLAAEESKLWKSYTPPDACTLGEGIAGIIDTLFARLKSNANHGPVLVERSLGYLASARYGLTEDEVMDVLTADDAVRNDFDQRKHHDVSERRLPVVLWSRLSLDLEPYLTERAAPGGTVIAFYHRQLAERAGAGLHAELARYFLGRPVSDTRRMVELPFQQREAHQWKEAEATLLDARFLFAKVGAGMVLDLDADYRAMPERSETLRLVRGALQLSMHVVAKDSTQFASQMIGRLLAYRNRLDLANFVDKIVAGAQEPWLRPMHAALHPPGTPLVRTLHGHSLQVSAAALTPDGRRAVSASWDKTLKLWDLASGRALRTLEGHSAYVLGVAVTSDGRLAISASADHTLKVWELETGSVLRTLRGHKDSVSGVTVTADGKVAVSASRDHTLRVWDLEGGDALRTLHGHSDSVVGVAVTGDGTRAVSASFDHTLKVWDLENGCGLSTLEGHSGPVFGVAVTPDGKRVVSASFDGTLRVWDLDTGRALFTLEGHSAEVNGVVVTPDGKRVVSSSWDRTLKVWDLDTGHTLFTLEGHSAEVNGVAVTPNGKQVVSASFDYTLKVWSLESGSVLTAMEGHSAQVSGVAVTEDGKQAVSGSFDHTLKVWDVKTGRAVSTLEGHSGELSGVAVTLIGKRVLSCSFDHTVKVWNLENGRMLRSLEGLPVWVYGVAVTANGKRAVSASLDHTLIVWDLEKGYLLRMLEGHSAAVSSVAMTPDGNLAVSASLDRTLKVWDLDFHWWTPRLWSCPAVRTLEGHTASVSGVAVTADGKRAVSASWDQTVKVWDLKSGRVLRTLEGHSGYVLGVAVTADGRRAVSVSEDRTLKVWDLESGMVLTSFGFDGQALCVACAPPNLIVAGDQSGRVYFLALEE